MPVSFTTSVAPPALFSMMPPAGPGTSLMTTAFCSAVWKTMLGLSGFPASA